MLSPHEHKIRVIGTQNPMGETVYRTGGGNLQTTQHCKTNENMFHTMVFISSKHPTLFAGAFQNKALQLLVVELSFEKQRTTFVRLALGYDYIIIGTGKINLPIRVTWLPC